MTTILKSLTLDAYRGITGLTLEGLTQFNLLVGANNAGKSSILEAAALLLRPVDVFQWTSLVRQRDRDTDLSNGTWSFFPASEALIADDGQRISGAMRIEGELSQGQRRIEATCFVTWNDGITDVHGTLARVDVSVDGQPEISLKFGPGAVVSHEVPLYRVSAVTPASHYFGRTLVAQLSHAIKEGKKQLAVQLMAIFDSEVEDLDIVTADEDSSICVTHRTRKIVDLASFGDGMRRSVALALALTRASQGVLLVDELEAGIHPSVLGDVMAKLLQAARESQVQILATTHSLETLDAVIGAATDKGNAKELTTFYLKREDGSHKVFRYDQDRLAMLRDGGLDIR